MCCDKCKYYIWYWDKCTKWDCIVDAREVHNCFEPISTPIYDYMVGKGGCRMHIYTAQKNVSEARKAR